MLEVPVGRQIQLVAYRKFLNQLPWPEVPKDVEEFRSLLHPEKLT
jgi:hypothetical protein